MAITGMPVATIRGAATTAFGTATRNFADPRLAIRKPASFCLAASRLASKAAAWRIDGSIARAEMSATGAAVFGRVSTTLAAAKLGMTKRAQAATAATG